MNFRDWLHLVSDGMYTSQSVCWRELIQNAVDACRMGATQKPEIHIQAEGHRLTVSDNGIGLTLEEQVEHYWKPHGSTKRHMTPADRLAQQVIGRFGIGAYSSFRVAQRVTLVSKSKHPGEKHPVGTSFAIDQPVTKGLDNLNIERKILSEKEANRLWSGAPHGAVVIIDFWEPVDPQQVHEWILKNCDRIAEPIFFNGEKVRYPDPGAPNLDEAETHTLPLAEENVPLTGLTARLAFSQEDNSVWLELLSLTGPIEGAGLCKGFVKLNLDPSAKREGLRIHKHGFPFATIDSPKSSTSLKKYECLPLEGTLDLPILEPSANRDGPDENGLAITAVVTSAVSRLIVSELATVGGEVLRNANPVHTFLWNICYDFKVPGEKVAGLEFLCDTLDNCTIQVINDTGEEDLVPLREIKNSSRDSPVFFVKKSDNAQTKTVAEHLARQGHCLVVKLSEPHYWNGWNQETYLKERCSAEALSHGAKIVREIEDEELGAWVEFRPIFARAIHQVMGDTISNIILSEIHPLETLILIPPDPSVIYLNFSNPKVAALPNERPVGSALNTIIRAWAYGPAGAERIEQELIKSGALSIVQEIRKLANVGPRFQPTQNDRFLKLPKGENVFSYAVRIPDVLCMDPAGAQSYFNANGDLHKDLAPDFQWVNDSFRLIAKGTSNWIVFSITTNFEISRDEKIHGQEPFPFRLKTFTDAFETLHSFVTFPDWLGEKFEAMILPEGSEASSPIRLEMSVLYKHGSD